MLPMNPDAPRPAFRIVAWPPVAEAPRGLRATLKRWRERARQRRALATLDERTLRDIGITRYDAIRESGKPFWR